MKNHLKRIAAPRTWGLLNRKSEKYTVRPHAGGHSLEFGLALGAVLRDHLRLGATLAEAQKLLHNNEVLVDGVRRKDRRDLVGLFDVISIPSVSKHFRVELDNKGRLVVKEISAEEASSKVARVTGKTMMAKKKLQLNLYDGKNIAAEKDVKVGDSVVLSLPDFKVKRVLSLKEGASIFLLGGKHAGSHGKLKSIEGNTARYIDNEGQEIETSKKYLYVVNE